MAGMAGWARTATGVITDHIREISEAGERNFVLVAMCRKKGRMRFNASATDFDWLATSRRDPPSRSDDLDPVSFRRVARERKATLNYKVLQKGELISKGEKLAFQSDKTARYKIAARVAEKLTENCMEYFSRVEMYNNAQAAANADGFDGLETIFQTQSGSISNSWHSGITGTYAGLTLNLGTYGGSANAASGKGYPMGTPDLAYHFWHPMAVSYKNTNLLATTKTWINTWRESMRKARTYMEALNGVTPDLWLADPISYEESLSSLEEKERFIIGDQDQDLVNLGFRHIRVDGIPYMSEFGCTAQSCYGISFKNMEIISMQRQLWDLAKDVDLSHGGAQEMLLDCYGNVRFKSPAFFAKLVNST